MQRSVGMSVFQENKKRCGNVYDIPYYRKLKKYLLLFGQDPYQGNGICNVILIVTVCSILGIVIPTLIELYTSLLNKDMDAVIECMPHLIASTTSIIKILNGHLNKRNFQKLLKLMTEEWKLSKENEELHVLNKITAEGSKLADLYRNSLLTFLVIFLIVPLCAPVLDIILPLNETRPRQQLFKVNYIFFNEEDHFYFVYLQLAFSASVAITGIVTIDSLYMVMISYISGMFALCGYQVEQASESNDSIKDGIVLKKYNYQRLRRCVITHNKAIQLYDILNRSSEKSYFIQIGLNILNISVTAVQTILNLDRPEEALRFAVFFCANQFHLFVLSVPGQVLIDHCSELAVNIYSKSKWYRKPVAMQRMIYVMQIRSNKVCILSAGGLYTLNMENFASTLKICMSYITVLLSLRN